MPKVLDSVTMPIKKNGTKTDETFINNPKSTAPQFSASTAYTVGQYVFYNKKLYRFTAAHAAGAWNASHVTEVTVGSEIASLKEDLADLQPVPITMTSGYYIALNGSTADISNPTTAASYSYAVVDCSEGDIFTINGTGGGSPRVYGFIDNNGTILAKAAASITVSDLLIFAPANSAKLIINDNSGKTSYKGATTFVLGSFISDLSTYVNPYYLHSTDDLNDFKTPGVYIANTGDFPVNYPQSYAETQKLIGFILVYYISIPNAITYTAQMVIDYKNHVYVRRCNSSGTWNTWTELASHDEVTTAITNITTAYTNAIKTVHALSAKIFQRVGCIGDSYTRGYISYD